MSSRLLIKNTNKYGQGVCANKDIKEGEIIRKFKGEIISLKECLKRVKRGIMGNDDGFQIGNEKYLVLDNISIYFNHSCNPNGAFRKDTELVAIKNIKKGQEITYDYSTTVGPNITSKMWTMPCNCKSKICRIEIGNVLTVPKNILRKYLNKGLLQNYIVEQLKNINC